MSLIYLAGRFERSQAIGFTKAVRRGDDYDIRPRRSVTERLDFTCVSTPHDGSWHLRIDRGFYVVTVGAELFALIDIPDRPGLHRFDDVLVRRLVSEPNEPVTRGGAAMVGPLLLHGSPNDSSDPRQAADKGYVDRQIVFAGESVHRQFIPVSYLKYRHGKGRVPSYRLTNMDGKQFHAPARFPDEHHIELWFIGARAFNLYI